MLLEKSVTQGRGIQRQGRLNGIKRSLAKQVDPALEGLMHPGRIFHIKGDIGNIVIDAGCQFAALIIASIPVNINGGLTARLEGIHLLAPPVINSQVHILHEAGTSRLACVGRGAALTAGSTFGGGAAIAVGTEEVIASVAIWRKHVGELIVRAILIANFVAQVAFIS